MTSAELATRRLREVATFRKGKPPVQQPYFGPGAELYLTPDYLRGRADAESVRSLSSSPRSTEGDTVILWDGSNAGEILRGRSGVLASTMALVSPNDEFERSYFFYALKRWEAFLKGQTSGSGIPHVDREIVGSLSLLRFESAEQRAVAEILSTLDAAIAQTRAAIAKGQRVKVGAMRDLLTRGIDDDGGVRSEGSHQLVDSALGRIPASWTVRKLSELASVERGKFTHRPRNDPRFYGGDHPFIQTGDVTACAGRTVLSYTQTLSDRGVRVSKQFPEGTVAITIAANIADTAILGMPMFFPDSVVGAITKAPNCTRFIEMSVRHWKPMLESMAPKSAQRNINLETLRPLPIATPLPDEQLRIAAACEAVDRAQASLEETERKLTRLKAGLAEDLLSGARRVFPGLMHRENSDE